MFSKVATFKETLRSALSLMFRGLNSSSDFYFFPWDGGLCTEGEAATSLATSPMIALEAIFPSVNSQDRRSAQALPIFR